MIAYTILGLPAHPLIVHGAVVGIPLAAIGVLAYALLRSRRPALWWPVTITLVVAWAFAILAGSSGEALEAALPTSAFTEEHAEWAEVLGAAMHTLAVTALLTLLIDRSGRRFGAQRVQRVLRAVALPVSAIAAAACIVLVAVVGHLGAQAVWHDSEASSESMQAKTAP
jgi:uncharacterized membrane protein